MSAENSEETIIQEIRDLRNKYKETEDIRYLNAAYKQCQQAMAEDINVSWYFPWVMYDYLKMLNDKMSANTKKVTNEYLHTLEVINKAGLFTNGVLPLDVQKKFILAVQNNICSAAWHLRANFTNLLYLYELGIKDFAKFDEKMIEDANLFHRDKSAYYGKEGFFEAIINCLFITADMPQNAVDVDKILGRFQQAINYFTNEKIPYYYFLITKIIRAIDSMTWNYYKSENEQLLDKCASGYVRLNIDFPADTNLVNIVKPLVQRQHKSNDKYCEDYPQTYVKIIDLIDLSKFNLTDYEKYQSDDGKRYPGLVERVLTSYLKAQSRNHYSQQQVKEISDRILPILTKHPDYTWCLYFYCLMLVQNNFYDDAHEIGLKLVKDNIANPNMWGLLAKTYIDDPEMKTACSYQACKKKTMSQQTRKDFIDGLLATDDQTYYPIIKHEVLQLKNTNLVNNYRALPWFDTVEANLADVSISQFDLKLQKLLYPDAKQYKFYVDWQNDRNYWIVIPDQAEDQYARYKIHKKLVNKDLKNDHSYKAPIVLDDISNKIKFLGSVTEIDDSTFTNLYLKEKQGTFSAVRDFGFIITPKLAKNEDYYCNSEIVHGKGLRNYDNVTFLAKYSYDKKKDEWKWEVSDITQVEHPDSTKSKKVFQNVVIFNKNKHGRIFGFVDDGNESCYISSDVLAKSGIKYEDYLDNKQQCVFRVAANRSYSRKLENWSWVAKDIEKVD